MAMSLVLDLERQLKNRRVNKPAQGASDFNKAMRSWAVDVDNRLRVLEGNLYSLFLWDATEPLAAAALQANDRYWERTNPRRARRTRTDA